VSAVATIRFLQQPTRPAWVKEAIAHLDTVLVDHAHCERKAAGVALSLISRYPTRPALVKALTAIAREELEHFDQVNRILEQRGVALVNLLPPPYGAGLNAAVRKAEPGRLLDSFLVAGLIEARSHERLGLLARHCGDPELRQLWGELLASEARHFGVYWLLAEARWPRAQLSERLEQLAAVEAAVLAELWPQPRMHS